jgi:competence protein ComEC
MKLKFLSVTLLRFSLFLCMSAGLFAQGQLKVTVLDLKVHGLAVVLQTPGGKTWLIDTGLGPKDDNNPARDVIVPFLQEAGVKSLDGVLISHPHSDHRGGLPYLMEHYQIGQLVDGGYDEIGGDELEEYRKVRAQYIAGGGKSVIVKLGSKLPLDPVLDAEVLWPPQGLYRHDPEKKDEDMYNAMSIVLRVQYGSIVFLFPGDNHGIGGMEMGKFLDPEKLKCDLLVAPHHGLNSNSAQANATKPKIVVVSSLKEYLNPLIHPYELTTSAFSSVGAQVYATWVHGTITAVSDGRTLQLTTTRQP